VPLELTEEQKESVLFTMQDGKGLFDFVVSLCNREKTCNGYRIIGPEFYGNLKEVAPSMPTALVQQIARMAAAAVKSFNQRNPKKKWQCPAGKKSDQYPVNKLTVSLRGNLLTFSAVGKRVRTMIKIPEWFSGRYGVSAKDLQAGQVIRRKKDFRICLVFKVKNETGPVSGKIVGVDRGLYNLVTLSDGTIFSNRKAIAVKRRRQHLRSALQQKGTRSAKRHLKAVSGRERRFMRDVNHRITKWMANRKDVAAYILEDLKGIRDRRRGRKLNSWLSNWSFHEFQMQLKYKCELTGIRVIYVDPRYTSQKCSCCGNIDKGARNRSRYVCPVCGHSEHADVNAAKNIRDHYASPRREDRALSTARTDGP